MVSTLRMTAMAVAVAGCALTSVPVHAELYKFHVKGTVTYSGVFDDGTTVPVGTPVTGTYVYDIRSKPDFIDKEPDGSGFAHYQPDPFKFKLQFEGHSVRSSRLGVYVFNDSGSQDMLSVDSTEGIYLDGVWYERAYFGLTLLSVLQPDAIKSLKLPRHVHVQDFNRDHYGYVRRDGGQTGTLLQFNIDKIRSEPCVSRCED